MKDHTWIVIAAVAAVGSLIFYIVKEIISPFIRSRRLENPIELFFNTTSSDRYQIKYINQDDEEHKTKDLVVPANTENLYIQLLFQTKVSFTQHELTFGFEGDNDKKPDVNHWYLAFITRGQNKKEPENYSNHIVDHHKYYHIQDIKSYPKNTWVTSGFKITTHDPGTYTAKVEISADGVVSCHMLTLIVEERPNTYVRCIDHKECFIKPKMNSHLNAG